MATNILSGQVIHKGSRQPLANAIIKLTNGTITKNTTTDENGDFSFSRENPEDIPDGKYSIFVVHSAGRTATEKINVEIPTADNLVIELVDKSKFSQRSGLAFGSLLLLALCWVCCTYYCLHKDNPIPLDKNLLQYVAVIDSQLTPLSSGDSLLPNSFIPNALATADTSFQKISQNLEIDSTDYSILLSGLFKNAQQAAATHQITSLKTIVQDGILPQLKQKPNSFFWREYPGRLLEIFFWALIATMVSLAISTGHYLYTNRFITDAIYRHVAVIFAVPILAVLIALLLSFVKISFALGEASLTIDLTDIHISILVASFIGLAHWKAWNYMNDLAKRFFTDLSTQTNGGNA